MTTDPELTKILQKTHEHILYDPLCETCHLLEEAAQTIQSWAAKQELRAVEKAQEKAVLLCVKVMTPHLSDKQMLAMIAQLQQELDKS